MITSMSPQSICAKISDFNTSRFISPDDTPASTKGVGTPNYMAPEILLGNTTYSDKTDVYSVGMVLWSLWTRKEPFVDDIGNPWQMYKAIIEGQRPPVPKPEDSQPPLPQSLLDLMIAARSQDPLKRPCFAEKNQTHEAILKTQPNN